MGQSGGVNQYAYAGNNPIGAADPSGTCEEVLGGTLPEETSDPCEPQLDPPNEHGEVWHCESSDMDYCLASATNFLEGINSSLDAKYWASQVLPPIPNFPAVIWTAPPISYQGELFTGIVLTRLGTSESPAVLFNPEDGWWYARYAVSQYNVGSIFGDRYGPPVQGWPTSFDGTSVWLDATAWVGLQETDFRFWTPIAIIDRQLLTFKYAKGGMTGKVVPLPPPSASFP